MHVHSLAIKLNGNLTGVPRRVFYIDSYMMGPFIVDIVVSFGNHTTHLLVLLC